MRSLVCLLLLASSAAARENHDPQYPSPNGEQRHAAQHWENAQLCGAGQCGKRGAPGKAGPDARAQNLTNTERAKLPAHPPTMTVEELRRTLGK